MSITWARLFVSFLFSWLVEHCVISLLLVGAGLSAGSLTTILPTLIQQPDFVLIKMNILQVRIGIAVCYNLLRANLWINALSLILLK